MKYKLLRPCTEFYTFVQANSPIDIIRRVYDAILSSHSKNILSQGYKL